MPRSELNVTHPHFLRNTLAAKQGITNFSEHQSLENRNRFERNPYSSKLRQEVLGDTEAGLMEDHNQLDNSDLNRMNVMQRNAYHGTNQHQNFFDVNKPQSATTQQHQHYHSKPNLRHQSLNVTKGALKSFGSRDMMTNSNSLATAAEKETNGDSSQNLLRSEMCQIKEFAKCKYPLITFLIVICLYRTKHAKPRQETFPASDRYRGLQSQKLGNGRLNKSRSEIYRKLAT